MTFSRQARAATAPPLPFLSILMSDISLQPLCHQPADGALGRRNCSSPRCRRPLCPLNYTLLLAVLGLAHDGRSLLVLSSRGLADLSGLFLPDQLHHFCSLTLVAFPLSALWMGPWTNASHTAGQAPREGQVSTVSRYYLHRQ